MRYAGVGATESEWPVPRDSSGHKPLLENPAAGRIMDMAAGGAEQHTVFKEFIKKCAWAVSQTS